MTRAASGTHRSQPGLSMQMRKLEALLGKRLFLRTGRGVRPTAYGETFFSFATRMLDLGDEAYSQLNAPDPVGVVRVALPEEVAIAALPPALRRVRRDYPGVRLEIMIDNSDVVEPLWYEGQLDVMVAAPSTVSHSALFSWGVTLHWVCGHDYQPGQDDHLDLIAFPPPCSWRQRMLEGLAIHGRDYRIVFTSSRIAAIQAAVESGLGIALLTPDCIRQPYMRSLPAAFGLPEQMTVRYGLYARRRRNEAIEAVVSTLLDCINGQDSIKKARSR